MADNLSFFDDDEFQDSLVALLVSDRTALVACAYLLHPDDFKPSRNGNSPNARSRWIVAELALEFFKKHQNPIKGLLRSSCLEYAKRIGLGQSTVGALIGYVADVQKRTVTAPAAITEHVVNYKRAVLKTRVLEDMIEANAAGKLTDDLWMEYTRQAMNGANREIVPVDYFAGLEDRITYRLGNAAMRRFPRLMIDPFDNRVRGLGPGHLGLVLAPPKRGKSLFLVWVALAYVLQRMNVLYFTLEDPREDVEERMDSAVTGILHKTLMDDLDHLRERFGAYRRFVNTKLKIIDGTQGGVSMAVVEDIYLREREQGFDADAIIIDYDDEIAPAASDVRKDRRFEFADVYRDMRQMAGRYRKIIWTGAQSQRGTEEMKILGSSKLAEDYSKARKVSLAVSLGKGDWGGESIYLWVAEHRYDVKNIGWNIMPDKSRMVIYDQEATYRAEREHAQQQGDPYN